MSVGQIPSGISAEVGPVGVATGSTQLPVGYYNQPQQYAPNSRSVDNAQNPLHTFPHKKSCQLVTDYLLWTY